MFNQSPKFQFKIRIGNENMIGIIMAAGSGSRMQPMTRSVSKHLMALFDKPLIYYPLTVQIAAGVKKIYVVCNPDHEMQFRALLGDGSEYGIEIHIRVQETPAGIVEGILLVAGELRGSKVLLSLGDNFFFGGNLSQTLRDHDSFAGAQVFAVKNETPEKYGVVRIDPMGRPDLLVEKPQEFVSDLVVTGIYVFDERVVELAKRVTPSFRGELEIIDLLNFYRELGELGVTVLSSACTWIDAGSPDGLLKASNFVASYQAQNSRLIGSPEEASFAAEFCEGGSNSGPRDGSKMMESKGNGFSSSEGTR